MTPERPSGQIPHFFTVDVEEYFQVNAFASTIRPEDWGSWPTRLDENIPPLLDALERHEARGTFFVLGWVAERMPHVVRRIAAAGHEIASHGYWHERIPTMTRAQFQEDVRSAKSALENVTGERIAGYRAPSFSLIPGFEWAFDVLIEEDYRYDSSLFPIRRRGYGYPTAERNPHVISRPNGRIAEFPLATTSIGGFAVPAAGGGYLRQLPFQLIRRAFTAATARGVPTTFYIHPWDIDPGQPRVPVSVLTRLRHYRGLSSCLERVERLLGEFWFAPIATQVDRVLEGTEKATRLGVDANRRSSINPS